MQAGLLQHSLGGNIFGSTAALDSGQPEFAESEPDNRHQGLRGEALPTMLRSNVVIDFTAVFKRSGKAIVPDAAKTAIAYDHSSLFQKQGPGAHSPLPIGLKAKFKKFLGVRSAFPIDDRGEIDRADSA